MRILLVGEYYSSNLGDPLLCETVYHCIEEEYPFAEIIPFDISGRVGCNQYYQMQKRTRQQKLWVKMTRRCGGILEIVSPFYRVYANSADRFMRVWYMIHDVLETQQIDLIVFAGGEMFMDYFTGPISILLKVTQRIPVIFHACGFYSLSSDAQKLLRRDLKKAHVKSISLRDSYTKFIDRIGLGYKIRETYDTALFCSKYFSKDIALKKATDLGVGIIGKEEYWEFQNSIVRDLLDSSINWKLFTNGSKEDYAFASKLLHANGVCECDYEKYLCCKPCTVPEFIQMITSFERIISFRMHSQICAASFGIPTYGFVWDEKVATFYEKMGLSDNYTRKTADFDLKKVLEKINHDEKCIQATALTQGELSKRRLISDIERALI